MHKLHFILLIFLMLISGCSLSDQNEFNSNILYLGNDQLFVEALTNKNVNFHQKKSNLDYDLIISDKEFIESPNGVEFIKDALANKKIVFIYGYSDTKYIQSEFLGSMSYDESKDGSEILVRLQIIKGNIEVSHSNYYLNKENYKEYKNLFKKIIQNY